MALDLGHTYPIPFYPAAILLMGENKMLMDEKKILPNEQVIDEVYNLLIEMGGANPDESVRRSFRLYHLTPHNYRPSEWRFCGHFGFGGKFRTRFWSPVEPSAVVSVDRREWYVDFYPEDKTSERAELAEQINEKLENLRVKYMP